MVDRQRLLAKVAELDSYLQEIRQIVPTTFEEYQKIEKKRSCERLLQLSIESLIDICKLLVGGLKLGLPSGENDLFEKLQNKKVFSPETVTLLKEMRAFRNILVHEYAVIDDRLVYEKASQRLEDFERIKKAILRITEIKPK